MWPGRRYQGKQGVAQAILASECVQVDTINVIARSHDLMLWSRVEDYKCAWLEELCYQDWLFFDYGTILMIYPGKDLSYFQSIMQSFHDRLIPGSSEAQNVHQHVLEAIAQRGPLANRDFQNRTRIPGGFNMVKDTSKALYHLYLSGQVMTHSRRNFERVYDLTSNIALTLEEHCNTISKTVKKPLRTITADVQSHASLSRFFTIKTMRDMGLATAAQWARRVTIMEHKRFSARQAAAHLQLHVAEGTLTTVMVEGEKEPYYLPAEDTVLLDALPHLIVPAHWQPLGVSTLEEVSFLAPLDNVIWDRQRTQALFDFTYVWEVYKPAHTRRWGYYTLPILYGDQLVGRIAPRLDRKSQTLNIEGFWLEADHWATDTSFRAALQAGLQRFARFHNAVRINPVLAAANQPDTLCVMLEEIARHINSESGCNLSKSPAPVKKVQASCGRRCLSDTKVSSAGRSAEGYIGLIHCPIRREF